MIEEIFPYERLRKGQKEAIEFIADVLSSGKIGLLHAPTGIGKTISALVGYLLARESGKIGVFLTRTKSQALVYVKELELLRRRGQILDYVVLRSKRDYCPLASRGRLSKVPYSVFLRICEALRETGKCPLFANSYRKGRPSPALLEAANSVKMFGGSPENIIGEARRFKVCPYELAKLLAAEAEIIIGSYTYIFNPTVREKFFTAIDRELRDIKLIVDEAHNLPDSATDSASISATTSLLEGAIKEAASMGEDYEWLVDYLKNLKEEILKLVGNVREKESIVDLSPLAALVSKSDIRVLREAGEEYIRASKEEEPISRILWLSDFLDAFRFLSNLEEFVPYAVRKGEHVEFGLKLIDPAVVAKEVFDEVDSAVLMSGSLYPMEYYEQSIGTRLRTIEKLALESPFPKDAMTILVDGEVTTKYTERSYAMLSLIARRLSAIIEEIPKTVLIVFPSYELMRRIYELADIERPVIVEARDTKLEEVMRRLERGNKYAIFSVAGGKLMEGIDYRVRGKTILGGVIIVGIPFPEVSELLKVKEEYFRRRKGGFWARLVTMIAPAVRKMLQAAGRLIRDESDRGFLVLMDKRFVENRYWRFFPPNWRRFEVYYSTREAVKKIRAVLERWSQWEI